MLSAPPHHLSVRRDYLSFVVDIWVPSDPEPADLHWPKLLTGLDRGTIWLAVEAMHPYDWAVEWQGGATQWNWNQSSGELVPTVPGALIQHQDNWDRASITALSSVSLFPPLRAAICTIIPLQIIQMNAQSDNSLMTMQFMDLAIWIWRYLILLWWISHDNGCGKREYYLWRGVCIHIMCCIPYLIACVC